MMHYRTGLVEQLLAIRRNTGDNTLQARLDMVSNGQGQLIAVGDSAGRLNSVYAQQIPGSNGGPWGSGTTTRAQTFNPRRWATPTQGDTISTFRTRQYDPATGVWLQEDPLGLAGGVNLYQYNGNDPNSFGDPFGTCVATDTLPDEITLTVGVHCSNGTNEEAQVTATRVKSPAQLQRLGQRAAQLQGGSAEYSAEAVQGAVEDAATRGAVYVYPSDVNGGSVTTGAETSGSSLAFRSNDWNNIQSGPGFMNRPGNPLLRGSTCLVVGHEGVHLLQHAMGILADNPNGREEQARRTPWNCR